MARICPQCSLENYDQAVFCARCGFRFSTAEDAAPLNNAAVPTPTPPTLPDAGYSGYAAQANPQQAGSPQAYRPAQSVPAAGPAPYAPPSSPAGSAQPGGSVFGQAYGSTNNDPYGAPGGGVYQQPFPQANMQPPQGQQQQAGMPPQQGQPFFSTGKQGNIGQRLSVVQRAFAGKGTPLVHTSWLLDGKQVAAEDMRAAIVEKVQQQYANEVKVSQEHLVEHESVLEEREYVRIERAPANVFIYVTSFGNDLYIARTTTVQPALSLVRMAVFGAMFLLMLIGFILSAASAATLIVSLFSAFLLNSFVAIIIHSLVLGFTEKDFLVYLRPNVLNDFRIDDGAILEHIADRGIRAAAEELALNTDALSAPTHSYSARKPIHVI
jgi:hypothetical protein